MPNEACGNERNTIRLETVLQRKLRSQCWTYVSLGERQINHFLAFVRIYLSPACLIHLRVQMWSYLNPTEQRWMPAIVDLLSQHLSVSITLLKCRSDFWNFIKNWFHYFRTYWNESDRSKVRCHVALSYQGFQFENCFKKNLCLNFFVVCTCIERCDWDRNWENP